MKQHAQRGAISLTWVAIGSVVIGGAVALALISMRNERNLFAEIWAKASGKVTASPVAEVVQGARPAPAEGPLRKCQIDGKTVYSNTECTASNPSSKDIAVHRTAGIEAPKAPPVSSASATSDPALDKAIEKQFK